MRSFLLFLFLLFLYDYVLRYVFKRLVLSEDLHIVVDVGDEDLSKLRQVDRVLLVAPNNIVPFTCSFSTVLPKQRLSLGRRRKVSIFISNARNFF